MKILMLAPQPFFEPRGTPFSVLGRLRALSSLGHEVDLVTYHVGQDVAIQGVKIHRIPRVGFIKQVKIGPSLPKVFLDVLLLFKAFQLLCGKRYDLLHTHEEASFFGILLAPIFRLPHLYDMHSSLTQQLSNFRYTHFRPLVRLVGWLEKKIVNSSDAIITICPSLEEHVAGINGRVPQVMIENVASGSEPSESADCQVRSLLEAHSALQGRTVVLYAGTFEAYQGIDLLIESSRRVIAQRPEVMFVLGGGSPTQVELYRSRVQELGLSSHFYFTGNRPPEEIPAFVSLARVLVSARIDGTNTPLKVYSYLQSGKPIVATNLFTHTQVLNPQVAVLPEPNPEDFGRGILSVLEDPDMAAALADRARVLFESKYTLRAYIEKTERVLELALAQ